MRDILSKGFGKIPKVVFIDPRVPIGSKALYALLCAYTGEGKTHAYPSRDLILTQFGIVSNTFYGYLSFLVDNDLISIEKTRDPNGSGQFSHNVYTIVSFPALYQLSFPEASKRMAKTILAIQESEDIFAAGYGIIPKMVMADKNISPAAKAVYSYHSVFAGSGVVSYAKQKDILYHLNISSGSYGKYCRELEIAGYIQRRTCREKGIIRGTEIELCDREPFHSKSSKPEVRKSDTVKSTPASSNPVESHADKSSVTIISNQTNTNPNISIFNPSNNKKNHLQIDELSDDQDKSFLLHRPMDGDSIITAEAIEAEMLQEKGLPYLYCFDYQKLEKAIRVLTQMDAAELSDEEDKQRYQLFVNALADMLNAQSKSFEVKGAKISYAKVYDALVPFISSGEDDYCESFVLAEGLFAGINVDYKMKREIIEVKNPLGFMKAIIWTFLLSEKSRVNDKIAYDFSSQRDNE